MVNPARQSFHCFGCGEGGDVFSFMMKYYNLTFPETLEQLAQRYQITLPEKRYSAEDSAKAEKRQKLFDANERAARLYQGRFKSFVVQDDDHIRLVCRYVERNALRANLVDRPEDYRFCGLGYHVQSGNKDLS